MSTTSTLSRGAALVLLGLTACRNPEAVDASGDGAGNGTEQPTPDLALEEVASGFAAPVMLTSARDGSGRLFVVEQPGRIRVIHPDGRIDATPFLDLTDKIVPLDDSYDERGLLGLAFHPDFDQNQRFFVYYTAPLRDTAPREFDHTNVVAQFQAPRGGNADPQSERILLEIDHPQSNHNGGTLAFGPDRLLYISVGDGGNRNDIGVGHPPAGNGQDVTTLLGSILRIDPDGATDGLPYGIPADNPFATREGADEIYAWGFRNPYRFSFDRQTGALMVGDAGQNLMEEVSVVERGHNYGWNIREGTLCFNPQNSENPPESCPDVGVRGEPLMPPVLTYLHPDVRDTLQPAIQSQVQAVPVVGLVVVGGATYRGPELPELHGAYVFGDWSRAFDEPSGTILIGRSGADGWTMERPQIAGRSDGSLGRYLLGFGEDADGSLYVLTSDTAGPTGTGGTIFRMTQAEPN